MEIYQTDNHYIILDGEYSLWCSRRHGSLEPKTGEIIIFLHLLYFGLYSAASIVFQYSSEYIS